MLLNWILKLIRCTFSIVQDPCSLFQQGISDHACVQFSITIQPLQTKRNNQPIHPQIYNDHRFQQFHEDLYDYAEVATYPHPERLLVHKCVLREAALLVRQAQQDQDAATPNGVLRLLISISRCVWAQRTKSWTYQYES